MRNTGDHWRRAGGMALCATGALLIDHVALVYAKGAHRADLLRRQWEEQKAHAVVASAREKAATGVSTAMEHIATGMPVARLVIPRIKLDAIVIEGVGDDELNAGPGHLPGSALPGTRGNAVISAHRDRHFSHLDELRIGDTIHTETGQSRSAWVIVGRRIIGRDTPALFESKDALLTLTTCWPVRYFGNAPDRLILSARPVESRARRSGTAT